MRNDIVTAQKTPGPMLFVSSFSNTLSPIIHGSGNSYPKRKEFRSSGICWQDPFYMFISMYWEEGYLEPDVFTYFFVFVAPWSLMLDQDLVVLSPPAWQSGEGSTNGNACLCMGWSFWDQQWHLRTWWIFEIEKKDVIIVNMTWFQDMGSLQNLSKNNFEGWHWSSPNLANPSKKNWKNHLYRLFVSTSLVEFQWPPASKHVKPWKRAGPSGYFSPGNSGVFRCFFFSGKTVIPLERPKWYIHHPSCMQMHLHHNAFLILEPFLQD